MDDVIMTLHNRIQAQEKSELANLKYLSNTLQRYEKKMFRFVFTSSCLWEGVCLIYIICIYLFMYSGIQHILCCVFLGLVYPMLPVSLDCPFLFHLRYSLTFIYIEVINL
jgi:hypothetical protein